MKRDHQRQRVYDAEADALPLQPEVWLEELASCQRWVDKITRSRWFFNSFQFAIGEQIIVDWHPNSTDAIWWPDRGVINLPPRFRCRAIILHELAHAVVDMGHTCPGWRSISGWRGDCPAHGWEYCQTYLRLVRQWMGENSYKSLRASFVAHGVRHKRPTTGRQVHPESMRALRLARKHPRPPTEGQQKTPKNAT